MIRLWFKILIPIMIGFYGLYFWSEILFNQIPSKIDSLAMTFNRYRVYNIELQKIKWPDDNDEIQSILDKIGKEWLLRIEYIKSLPNDQTIVENKVGYDSDAALRDGIWVRGTFGSTNDQYIVALDPNPGMPLYLMLPLNNTGWVSIHLDAEENDAKQYRELEAHSKSNALFFLVIMGLSSFFIAGLIAGFIVWRIQILRARIGHIANGHIESRVPKGSKDLIGQLGSEFNLMVDRLQELVENQRHLLRAVAHEIRTPMARIDMAIELAKGEGVDNTYINGIREDLDEMDDLVRSLTRLMRIEHNKKEMLEDVSIAEIIDSAVAQHGVLAGAISIEVKSEDSHLIKGYAKDLQMAIANLLSNALRYAKTTVIITCKLENDEVFLTVDDDGPGIPIKDRERLKEAFACGDQSHNKKSGGIGLGLALVDQVMRSHGGTFQIYESTQGGARMSLRWPSVVIF